MVWLLMPVRLALNHKVHWLAVIFKQMTALTAPISGGLVMELTPLAVIRAFPEPAETAAAVLMVGYMVSMDRVILPVGIL